MCKRSASEKKIKEKEKYLPSFKRKLDRADQEVNSSSFVSPNCRYFVSFLFNCMEIIIARIVDNGRFQYNPEQFHSLVVFTEFLSMTGHKFAREKKIIKPTATEVK